MWNPRNLKIVRAWCLLVGLVLGHGVPAARAAGISRPEVFARLDVVLCLDHVIVYSIRTGELPALCAYSPPEQAVLWRRVTSQRVVQAVLFDANTFAMIEDGGLQFRNLTTGESTRRVALDSLPWAPPADRVEDRSGIPGGRHGMVFHSPRVTPSGICVWRDSSQSAGWGLIGDDDSLRIRSPDGWLIGYAPNGRPLLQTGYVNPGIQTIRKGTLVDATGLLFKRLRSDYPDMDFSLFPRPEFSDPGRLVVAMRRRDAPRPARGRMYPDRMVVLEVHSGLFTTLRSKPRRGYFESWAVNDGHVYRYSSSIDHDGGHPSRAPWIEVYDLESGVKRGERDFAGLAEEGTLWLRGFTAEGDAVFVYQRFTDPPPLNPESSSGSRVFILDASSLATRKTWPLSVDGGPAWAQDVDVNDTHGIVQTFGHASVLGMPSTGARRYTMGIRALDPASGEERWRHTEHMILEPLTPAR
jgi:hypothetical protein